MYTDNKCIVAGHILLFTSCGCMLVDRMVREELLSRILFLAIEEEEEVVAIIGIDIEGQ